MNGVLQLANMNNGNVRAGIKWTEFLRDCRVKSVAILSLLAMIWLITGSSAVGSGFLASRLASESGLRSGGVSSVRFAARCSHMAWCPFCTALKPTLAEEIEATDAVVFAKVLGQVGLTEDGLDYKWRLQVTQILKGKSFVIENDEFEAVAPASMEVGQECLVMGVLIDRMMWSTPMKLTERSREYILAVQTLPPEGPDRVKFFLNYLEDAESFMAFDAYDEFARAPYDVVKAIKADMKRENLIKWVQDPEVSINRKRLYFTLIGVCGLPEDLTLLERLITSPEKRDRAALDSLIACYLTLSGSDGVKLIEDRFLRDKGSEYVDTYAAVAALRFHGTESDVIPVPRIVEAVRLLLDRPDVADLVIADLARWKDWTVTDRLVEMFKNADDKTQWVRVPIVHYLRVNPDPIAKAKIEELRTVDPQSVRRALAFFELEAVMEPEISEEDAEFERQLQELEAEKLKEAEGGKGNDEKEEPSQGSTTGGESKSEVGDTPAPVDDDESGEGGDRTTVFRPVVEPPVHTDKSKVALNSIAGSSTVPTAAQVESDIESSTYFWIVGVPVVVNGLLIVLAWSILNGTFSRLFS